MALPAGWRTETAKTGFQRMPFLSEKPAVAPPSAFHNFIMTGVLL